ncbi:MAG: hypothetical protein PGN29_12240 [Gordonia paraffinivorans]
MDGYFYFGDLRPGPRNGCIRSYHQDGADPDGPLWATVTDMLSELGDSLRDGSTVDGWDPHVVDGSLEWEPI